MPRNTPVPLILGALSFALGFGLVWRIWWLSALSITAIVIALILRSFDRNTDYIIPAAEVERMERLGSGVSATTDSERFPADHAAGKRRFRAARPQNR